MAEGGHARIRPRSLSRHGAVTAAAAATPGFMHYERSDADKADLDRISASLNSVHSLKGGFVQIGPDGQVDQGTFYIQKPGRMRFEYAAPNPVLIVSDGSNVAVQNRRSTRWTLSAGDDAAQPHPLRRPESEAQPVHRRASRGTVSSSLARAPSSNASGNITIVFSDPGLELRQWTVVDAQGYSTTVSLRDLKQDTAIDPTLYKIADASATGEK